MDGFHLLVGHGPEVLADVPLADAHSLQDALLVGRRFTILRRDGDSAPEL